MNNQNIDLVKILLCVALLVSIVYSKFLLSVTMIGLLALSIIYKRKDYDIKLNLASLFTVGIFLITLFSITNSSNFSDWFHHVKMRLPFIVLPLAFFNLPKITKRQFQGFHYLFSIVVFLSAIPVMTHYFTHYEEVMKALGKGQPLETPVNHVKYSMFLAFSILSMVILLAEKYTWKYSWERVMQILMLALSLLALHILAVRTGIVAFYISAISLALLYSVRTRKWKVLISTFALFIVVPFVSYKTIPSLHKRVSYMIYDFNKYREGKGDQYSDSDRIQSLQIGYKLFKENPVIGTGIGDLKDECTRLYIESFGPEKYVLYPHNQYLFILASMGILGFIVFITCFAGPYFFLRGSYLLWLLGIITATTFLIDNVLERSFSTGFYVFFLCIGISYLSNKGELKNKIE